jgi:Zn-dependent protease
LTISSDTGVSREVGPQEVIAIVHSLFSVRNEFIREDGAVEFMLDRSDSKRGFLSLLAELRPSGLSAWLRQRADKEEEYILVVFKKPLVRKRRNLKLPAALFVATVVAVVADGFLRPLVTPPVGVPRPSFGDAILFATIYAASLMAILGIHELGHKVASWHHKMESSWPYFIPGIPGIWPTFGAVISASEPPPNRDALFDLGLSGPVAGLLVTVVVSVFAMFTAQIVPLSSVPSSLVGSADYYTGLLLGLFRPGSAGGVVTGNLFSLLYFSYSIGFLITFVNLLPAWQLDGGHIANSAVSPKVHRVLTYASIVVMFLVGFWLMALLILAFSRSSTGLQPLDNVSPLSAKRKLFFALTWILAIAIGALVVYNNPWFGFGPIFRW